MGFTTGFTGGVTLTLSVAYLTVLAHQRHRQRQCDVLRANTGVLRALALSDPIAAARLATPHAAAKTPADLSAAAAAQEFYYPSKSEPPRQPRSSFVEELKTRWNAEVEGAVRKVQTTDWVEVRENAEGTLSRLWGQAFGSSPGETASTATSAAASTTATAAAAVKERVAAATETVKAEAKTLQAAAQTRAREAAAAAKNTAGRVVDKSRDVLAVESARAKTAVAKAAGKPTDVELALQERFSGAEEDQRMKKSVGELLDERYKQQA